MLESMACLDHNVLTHKEVNMDLAFCISLLSTSGPSRVLFQQAVQFGPVVLRGMVDLSCVTFLSCGASTMACTFFVVG